MQLAASQIVISFSLRLSTNSCAPRYMLLGNIYTWSWYGVTTPMLFASNSPQDVGHFFCSSHNLSTTSKTCRPTQPAAHE